MPKVLQAFEGSFYNHGDELFSGELFLVKSCDKCHDVIMLKESETYIAINPKKQKTENVICPNCGNTIKIRDIK